MKDLMNKFFGKISENMLETPFMIKYWDGETANFGTGKPKFTLIFNTEKAAKKALYSSSLGFGEEYVSGGIDIEGDLQKLLKIGSRDAYKKIQISLKDKVKIALYFLAYADTLKGSRKNIAHHYDLGNDFYSLWLDKSMTYSCAYFKSKNDTLEKAQQEV